MKKLLTLSLLALAISGNMWAQFRVTDLRLEHMTNPTVVDAATPRFSWINQVANAKERGQVQTAYQLVVATSPANLKKGVFDVWDTGKVESNECNLVSYGGPELQSGRDYYWQVRTWNQQGKPSAWSAVAQWGMGLKPQEWTAKWIQSAQDDGGAPFLRKAFKAGKAIQQAKAFICGLGYFELYVNGQRIGDDYLVPNFTNYTPRYDLDKSGISIDGNFRDYRVLYLAYDVTKQLQQGDNAMGVILGNGLYKPDKGLASIWGHPCLICQLQITYTDGSSDVVVTDQSWKTHNSPLVYSGVYRGELYNANLEIPDWATTSCNESGWDTAQLAQGPEGQLCAMTSPGDKITLTLKPTSLKKVGDKTWEVTFDREVAGWIHFLNIQGNKGDTLQVNFVCESDQGIERYVFSGQGKESYQPRFTWFTFSKATIRGVENLTEANLLAEAVNTDVHEDAEFQTSNDLLNQINTIWRRSALDNMHGCIASDCPHRERVPYTGDGEASTETVMLNFDAGSFYQKWIRDIRDAQNKETGYVPNSAPWQPAAGGGVAWGAAMNIMPWQYYVQYGDRQMLELSYPCMKEQVRYMLTWVTLDGIMNQQMRNFHRGDVCYWLNLGDWCPPYGLPRDPLVHTFYLWQCLDYTARAGRALGQNEEAAQYQQMADKVRDNFHRYFYNEKEHSYGEHGSNIYALRMGVPDAVRQGVIASTRKEIMETRQGHINTGFLGTKYFFETLTDNGMNDVAYTAMTKTDFPSYGNWIKQGATVTWEQWNGNDSHNHHMFGSGLTWLYRRLAGVQADESQPGYRHVIIRPSLVPDLQDVRYAKQTPYGRVSSEIIQRDGKTQFLITVPVGSTATVYLPTTSTITESGKPLDKAVGVSDVSQKDGETQLNLQQGTYKLAY